MKLALRVLAVAAVLAVLCLLTFALWGDRFETVFGRQACVEWFRQTRPIAWLAAIGLLVSDLLLPVPATGVMAALGNVYGVPLGALIGATGSILAALIGYSLARLAGLKGIRWIAHDDEIARFRTFFDRWGGLAIIASRALPILPEVTTVLAGLSRMTFWRFLAALLLGTLPVALLFAFIGHAAADRPWYGILLASGIPLLIWPLALGLIRRGRHRRRTNGSDAPQSSEN